VPFNSEFSYLSGACRDGGNSIEMVDSDSLPALNILYDHQIFQAQGIGGVSRYFFELITRVARMPGVSVSVFQGLHINRCGLEMARSEFQSFFGIHRPEIPRTGRVFSAVNRLLFRRFASKSQADAYHATYYDDPYPSFRGMRVLTVYDMIHELFPDNFPGDPTAQRKRLAVEKADRIIAISEATKRDLTRILGTPSEKIQVVYLANSLRSDPDEPVRGRTPYFLYVGNRAGYKNFDLTLEAFGRSSSLNKDFQFVCFGGPPLSAREQDRICTLGLQGRVAYSSGSDAALASLYKHAAFFICPSLYEGFGLPVLEAMHYACPVLCANTSSLPEVAGDAAMFFDPHNLESIINAMQEVAYSNEKRTALGQAGRVQEAKFSWDRCARETVGSYRT